MAGCKITAVFEAVELHASESTSIAILMGTETISFDNGDPTQVVTHVRSGCFATARVAIDLPDDLEPGSVVVITIGADLVKWLETISLRPAS